MRHRCRTIQAMSQFLPNDDYMTISFRELEAGLTMMGSPDKLHQISDTVSAIRAMNRTCGPERALMTLIGGIAYITDEATVIDLKALLTGSGDSSAARQDNPSGSGS